MTIDLKVLKTKYPAEYSAIFEAGVAAERDRVQGHLKAASLSGATALAHEAIADGRDVATLSNAYLEAGLRQRHQRDRQEDDDAIAGSLRVSREPRSAGGDAAQTVANIVTGGGINTYVDADVRIEAVPHA